MAFLHTLAIFIGVSSHFGDFFGDIVVVPIIERVPIMERIDLNH
jgi:hypothetical protein